MNLAGCISFLLNLVVLLAAILKDTCGNCKPGKVTTMQYSYTLINHTIVGPVMSNITAMNERECEIACHLASPLDMCYMFNYYPSSKLCELLYKDRAAEYKVEKKNGSTFKTRKCISNPCAPGYACFSLGYQSNNSCLFFKELRFLRINNKPVCFEGLMNRPGNFQPTYEGFLVAVKLVHRSGQITCDYRLSASHYSNWGCHDIPQLEDTPLSIFITDESNQIFFPKVGATYTTGPHRNGKWYSLHGFDSRSDYLVLQRGLNNPLYVSLQSRLKLWYGEDLFNYADEDNSGRVCVDIYGYFV